jgi:hypothetical protein
MEIEKKRETSWKIQLKKTEDSIEITSVEIGGEVRLIKLALINKDKTVKVEMQKEDFFKFLSLISAFKDVVIGEDILLNERNYELIKTKNQEIHELSKSDEESYYQINHKSSEETHKNNKRDELNPEEWDPW